MRTGRLLDVLSGHEDPVHGLVFSPTSVSIFIFLYLSYQQEILGSSSWDRPVCLWDVSDGKGAAKTFTHTHNVLTILYRPDGKQLASSILDGQMYFWDPIHGLLMYTIEGHIEILGGLLMTDRITVANSTTGSSLQLSYSADGNYILARGSSKYISMYDVADQMSYPSASMGSGSRTARRTVEFGRTYLVRPKAKHQATIIWLHGLGDNGSSWLQLFDNLPLPNVGKGLSVDSKAYKFAFQHWIEASVASKFSLSQTGFLNPIVDHGSKNPRFQLRWFTPVTEVVLLSVKEVVEFELKLDKIGKAPGRGILITGLAPDRSVIVVSCETSCGKTTQSPQYILETEIDGGRGAVCSIVCTQPIRISAMSIAERVAIEPAEMLRDSFILKVGYKVRLEGIKGRDTCLLFCTTGILLRRLLLDRSLQGVTHVIVDEIHKRGMNEAYLDWHLTTTRCNRR